MTTTYTSPTIDQIAISADGSGDVVPNCGDCTFGTASTTIVVGDIGVCTILPAFHVPVDLIGDIGDCDSGSALVFEVGFVANDSGADDDPDAFGSGYTTGQAGGVFRANSAGFMRIAAADHDRKVGIQVTTAGVSPSTPGVVSITMLSRRAITGRD